MAAIEGARSGRQEKQYFGSDTSAKESFSSMRSSTHRSSDDDHDEHLDTQLPWNYMDREETKGLARSRQEKERETNDSSDESEHRMAQNGRFDRRFSTTALDMSQEGMIPKAPTIPRARRPMSANSRHLSEVSPSGILRSAHYRRRNSALTATSEEDGNMASLQAGPKQTKRASVAWSEVQSEEALMKSAAYRRASAESLFSHPEPEVKEEVC